LASFAGSASADSSPLRREWAMRAAKAWSGVDLAQWPALHAYFRRMHKRASIATAFAEEMALYQEEQARAAAAA